MRAVLCGSVVVFAGLSLACGLAGPTDATSPPSKGVEKKEPEKKVYTRDEFRALVVGKTPEQILKAVGKPSSTQDAGDTGAKYWYYRGATRDPITGNIDRSAQVAFSNGVAVSINF